MSRFVSRVAVAALVVAVLPLAAQNAGAQGADPLLPAPLDCEQWRYDDVEPGPLPGEWDPDDDKFTARRAPG